MGAPSLAGHVGRLSFFLACLMILRQSRPVGVALRGAAESSADGEPHGLSLHGKPLVAAPKVLSSISLSAWSARAPIVCKPIQACVAAEKR